MKRIILLPLILFILAFIHPPAGAGELFIDPRIDLPIIASTLTLSSLIELTRSEPLLPTIPELDRDRVNPIDRAFAGVNDPFLSDLSYFSEFATVLLPLSAYYLLSPDRSTLGDDLILLTEIVSVNYFLMRLTKSAVDRPRPLVYADGLSEEELRKPDNFASFYSGHTVFAFSFAVGISLIARERELSGPARGIISGSALTLAAVTGGLRIAAGKHFPTDVLAGAIVSSALTWLIVELHRTGPPSLPSRGLEFDGRSLLFRVPL